MMSERIRTSHPALALALALAWVVGASVSAQATPPKTCQGSAVTKIYGLLGTGAPTDGDDVVDGTPAVDVYAAGLGLDRMFGREMGDKLCGNEGNDIIYPGGGSDIVNGGAGGDQIAFSDDSAGNDTFYGGSGVDWMNGGSGDDAVYGDKGEDDVGGGWGNDRVYGGDDSDNLYDGPGVDYIDGGAGRNDWFYPCSDGETDTVVNVEYRADPSDIYCSA
jgi:Ca2+-binding RTX toxin-like protein